MSRLLRYGALLLLIAFVLNMALLIDFGSVQNPWEHLAPAIVAAFVMIGAVMWLVLFFSKSTTTNERVVLGSMGLAMVLYIVGYILNGYVSLMLCLAFGILSLVSGLLIAKPKNHKSA